jgi:hypothetical protein
MISNGHSSSLGLENLRIHLLMKTRVEGIRALNGVLDIP